MKISEVFKKRDRGVSFEFFPPKTDEGLSELVKTAKELEAYNPLYASVTYGAGGSTRDRTRGSLLALKEKTGLTLMSHLTCIGATREGMDGILKDYKENGIENILALRGDPPHEMYEFDREAGEFRYARDLVKFIKRYDFFSTAVAVYPEGHQEAPSLEADLQYAKEKIDAGADFAITQMFFDNLYFYNFMENAGKIGITVPILPGIMPLADFEKVKKFASFCKATVPRAVEEELSACAPGDGHKRGIEATIRQCEDLIKNGVKYLHFYTLNRAGAMMEIISALGLERAPV